MGSAPSAEWLGRRHRPSPGVAEAICRRVGPGRAGPVDHEFAVGFDQANRAQPRSAESRDGGDSFTHGVPGLTSSCSHPRSRHQHGIKKGWGSGGRTRKSTPVEPGSTVDLVVVS